MSSFVHYVTSNHHDTDVDESNRVLHVAARVTRGARQLRLRIDATWRWATPIATAWQRIRAAFP